MNSELELLNDLRSAGVLLWAKGEGRLGFSFPQDTGFPQPLVQQGGEARVQVGHADEGTGMRHGCGG